MKYKIECVYVLEAVGLDRIKIGFTTDLIKRLKTIQTSCPAPVQLRAVFRGDKELEAAYHEEYAACRVCGEWFVCDHDTAMRFGNHSNKELLEEIRTAWCRELRERHERKLLAVLGDIFAEMCQ